MSIEFCSEAYFFRLKSSLTSLELFRIEIRSSSPFQRTFTVRTGLELANFGSWGEHVSPRPTVRTFHGIILFKNARHSPHKKSRNTTRKKSIAKPEIFREKNPLQSQEFSAKKSMAKPRIHQERNPWQCLEFSMRKPIAKPGILGKKKSMAKSGILQERNPWQGLEFSMRNPIAKPGILRKKIHGKVSGILREKNPWQSQEFSRKKSTAKPGIEPVTSCSVGNFATQSVSYFINKNKIKIRNISITNNTALPWQGRTQGHIKEHGGVRSSD